MMTHWIKPLLLSSGLLIGLSACSLFSSSSEEKEDKKPEQRNPNLPPDKEPTVDELALSQQSPLGGQSLSVSTPEELAKIDNLAEGPVFFTDPDNPDAEIEGITDAFEGARERARWLPSLSRGLRSARQNSLPTLIWFHDSMLSPKSKAMARDLFETPDYLAWMKGKVVAVRLDSSEGFDESGFKKDSNSSKQNVMALRRRYGVKKIPTFVVVSARGKVVSHIDASDGFISTASQSIREGIALAEKNQKEYMDTLRKQGYRDWTNARGNVTIFAKLKRFDRAKDMAYLVEHTGKRRRVKLFDFSAPDIEYLDKLK